MLKFPDYVSSETSSVLYSARSLANSNIQNFYCSHLARYLSSPDQKTRASKTKKCLSLRDVKDFHLLLI